MPNADFCDFMPYKATYIMISALFISTSVHVDDV